MQPLVWLSTNQTRAFPSASQAIKEGGHYPSADWTWWHAGVNGKDTLTLLEEAQRSDAPDWKWLPSLMDSALNVLLSRGMKTSNTGCKDSATFLQEVEEQHTTRRLFSLQLQEHEGSAPHVTSLLDPGELHNNSDVVWARPHLGAGPEIVVFGLRLQKLHGFDFSLHHFLANMTLTLRWIDTRAANLILSQGGVATVLVAEAAQKLMWLPSVEITHPDLADFEEVSSMVSLSVDGTIQQSINAVARMALDDLRSDRFPFDVKSLRIEVKPKVSGLSDVVLMPATDSSLTGADENAFTIASFRLLSSSSSASTVGDGADMSSIGEVSINIRRDIVTVLRKAVIPSVATLMLSFAVFFLPLDRALHVVPRILVSALAIALQLQLAKEIEADRPMPGVQTWLDVFHECNAVLSCAAAVLNLSVMLTYFLGGHTVLSVLLDDELRMYLPLLTVGLHSTCIFSIGYDFSLPLALVTRILLAISIVLLVTGCIARWQSWGNK
jgi:hypothetical protein